MNVFISSTYIDLIEYRQAAIEVLNRYKCVPLAMEFFGSRPGDPTTVCEKEIKECDVFVGIYAHRYGFIPEGETKSITHLEYELAKKLGKDCLCFIVQKNFPWNPEFVEIKKHDELDAFLAIVKKEKVVSFFESAKDFESKLATSLATLKEERQAKENKRDVSTPLRPCIPVAPTPFVAHPYLLQKNFTGREAEMAMLSHWLLNEKEPVLVLEAIGGMGKSALSWVWLHDAVMERHIEIDGVFWWSFYEAPFETFLPNLACYVLGKVEIHNASQADIPVKLQAALQQRRFLLILDGLERLLRGYAGMEAMFIQEKGLMSKPGGGAAADTEWEKRQREPVNPHAARFLAHLAASHSKTKTLITTRLMPVPLENLAGVKHVSLTGLSPGDAVRFLRSEGVKGTRAELEQAGHVYDFHPLMLKLLASAIRRSRTKDVQQAFRENLIDSEEPQEILVCAFQLLSEEERQAAKVLSVFRSVFTFETAKALLPDIKADRLWRVLQELQNLGIISAADKEDRFDFHPIMRSFLYDRLTDKNEIHDRAAHYFQALPRAERIVTLEDLAPTIELYHHLVKAGKYDEAKVLFRDRLHDSCYYQLSAYQLIIKLLTELFPDEQEGDAGKGEAMLPRLSSEEDQAWTLNKVANAFALSGQPAKAAPLYLQYITISEKNKGKRNLAIGQDNIAQDQIIIGQGSTAAVHLRKSIALCLEINDRFWETLGRQELGHLLAFQGNFERSKEELAISTAYLQKEKNYQGLSLDSAFRSLSDLVQSRLAAALPGGKSSAQGCSLEAAVHAREALEFAEKTKETLIPFPRDFIQAYRLLGEALLQWLLSPGSGVHPAMEIPFYDDYFQQQVETVQVKQGNVLVAVERCLSEALRRCRMVNLVEMEADILLAHARMEWAKLDEQPGNRRYDSLPALEDYLKEARDIALRAGFRIPLADLHLFCGQALVQIKEEIQKELFLLGQSAREHLQQAKEYAMDVSEFSHIYHSPDPEFYAGIPEYEMLKRGMTEAERIRNGYFPVYRIADLMLKKIEGKKVRG